MRLHWTTKSGCLTLHPKGARFCRLTPMVCQRLSHLCSSGYHQSGAWSQGHLCWLQVLTGVHIMFSRVIPLQDGRPELHPMWRKAVKFGATCTTQPSDAVTHVAAYVNGTEKVWPIFAVRWADCHSNCDGVVAFVSRFCFERLLQDAIC